MVLALSIFMHGCTVTTNMRILLDLSTVLIPTQEVRADTLLGTRPIAVAQTQIG